MKRPKKKREHRIGSGIRPDVYDSALLGLQSRVKFHQSELTAEKDPAEDLAVAKQRVKEAKAAYKEHPCDAMHKELNDAIRQAERMEELELRQMDPSKAFQIVKRKALSFRAKADDVMKQIRNTKLERNEAQMRADGRAVLRVDKKRAKLEARFALLVDEMRRYQKLMSAVYNEPDFAERNGVVLNDEKTVAKSAKANNDRIVRPEETKTNAKVRAQVKSTEKKISPRISKEGERAPGRGITAKSKGAGEIRSEKLKDMTRWGLTEAEQMRYVELLMKKERGEADFSESEDFAQTCERTDGSVYGTSGQCRKGKPISLKSGEGMPAAYKKAIERGVKHKDAKRIADEVRAEKGVKRIKHGAGLTEAQQRLGEAVQRVRVKGGPNPVPSQTQIGENTRIYVDMYKGWNLRTLKEQQEAIEETLASPSAKGSVMQRNGQQMLRAVKQAIKEKENQAGAKKLGDDTAGRKLKNQLNELTPPGVKNQSGIKGFDLKKQFDSKDSKSLGEGAMGAVKEVKGPPPGIVKKGAIGENEAAALKKLQGTGITPDFYGSKITGKARQVDEGLGGHVNEATGMLGMAKAKGKPMMNADSDVRMGTGGWHEKIKPEVADEFVRMRATLHKNGVAHNDMHGGNVFYDKTTGKMQLVDMGLAQVSNRAALQEAIGGLNGMDWQGNRVISGASGDSANIARYRRNYEGVKKAMKKEFPVEAAEIYNGSIRSKMSLFDEGSLTEADAMRYIDMLYEGIQ